MNCPKCNEPMDAIVHQSVEVDRCTGCSGIWFDAAELEQLSKLVGSERIDVGDPRRGRVFDEEGRGECPRCATPLIRMVALRQPHLHYECCKLCGGVFLDAGEF